MQINKKLNAMMVIALLALSSIVMAVPLVSAEITLDPTLTPTSGEVGTEVTVSAPALGASPFSTVTVYLDALSGQVLGTGSADNTGAYSIDVTVPATTGGLHYLVVNDGETESAGSPFTVLSTLSANATLGLPGDVIQVTGDGFGASEDVRLSLNSTGLGTPNNLVLSVTPITDASGSFSVDFVVPAIDLANFTDYQLEALDETGNWAYTVINVDYYITLTPSSGPTGITTTIAGRIAPDEAYTITFNGAAIASGTTTSDGSYSMTYTIPSILSVAGYPVQVTWNLGSENREATFTVNPSPIITLSAVTGILGAEITVTGTGFSNEADISVIFGGSVVNDTSMGFGPTTVAGAIPADATFTVPSISLATYAVVVEDQYGAVSNTVLFTIEPTPVLQINTRATEYMQGDLISIYTWSNMPITTDFEYVITDPTGIMFAMASVGAGAWTMISTNNYMVETYMAYLPAYMMTLPNDAPVGVWNFTATMGTMQLSNLFTVSAPAGLEDVMAGIANVTDDIAAVSEEISDLSGEISDISGDVATVQTNVGQVKTLVQGLDITSLTGDLATIKSDLGTLTMDVAQLDAVVTAVAGDVAQVWTTVGTIEGKVTSIEGNTATIETDVGTLQADISDVKANVDSTPAWIAVVLALVAAVAAIFAVITIRQKIAG